ncbi:hypothetical protein BGZ68_003652, partial [Mortierella alpina]
LLIANEVESKREANSNQENLTLLAILHQTKCQNLVGGIGINLRKSWDDLVAEERAARLEGSGASGQEENSAMDFGQEQEEEKEQGQGQEQGQERQDARVRKGSAASFDHRAVARRAVIDLYRCLGFSGGDTALPDPPCTIHDAYYQMVNEMASEFGQFYTKLEFEL